MVNKEQRLKFVKILIIILILEMVVFNINSYRLLFGSYEKKEYSNEQITVNSEDGMIFFEISDINLKVGTIKLDISGLKGRTIDYTIGYNDEATKDVVMNFPTKSYINDFEQSKSISCFLSGDVSKIVIKVSEGSFVDCNLEKITINKMIPFNFNIIRFIVIFLVAIFLYAMKHSKIMNSKYDYKSWYQEKILIAIMCIFLIINFWVASVSSSNDETYYNKEFVDAILDGKVSLEDKPSEALLGLEDPYDRGQRDANGLKADEDFKWDVALYKGEYYMYFGIVPTLIMFIPFYVQTGTYLPQYIAVLIFVSAIIILLKEILCRIFKRWFENIPFKVVILSLISLLSGSLLWYLMGRAVVYEVAIASGLYFSLQGIFFIFKGTENKEIKYRYIFLGALFLAISVGCRPTQLLTSIIVLPMLLKIFIQNIKSKQNIIKSIISIGLPYMTVGILLMWYNYIRFENIFEFGAIYQLTSCNVNRLESGLGNLLTGLYTNLFFLPLLRSDFPFVIVQRTNSIVHYGYYFSEGMAAGLFILSPICLSIFSIFKVLKKIENKELSMFLKTLIITGVTIICSSIFMGGSTQRYMADYAWMLILAAIIIFSVIYNSLKSEEAKKIYTNIFFIIACYTFIINLLVGMISEDNYFERFSPEKYYKTKYTICFWE